ncbi:MAG: peptidylprolyl isomerase [Spongiibacteraceae bacterium]|nr:peptidylprolyl isomerase [Spongiibacteraceae bacterium]
MIKHLIDNRNTNALFKRLALVALLTLSYTAPHTYAAMQMLDQVIAIVDDDVILVSELTERIKAITANIQKSGNQVPAADKLHKDILEQLIRENIQMQIARRVGVRISDAQLNDAMARIAKQNRMTLAQFQAALESDGSSYTATREQIRRDMILQRVQQGNVNQRVQITEQEISNFLNSDEGQTLTAPEYRLLHALIPVNSASKGNVDEKARLHAKKLYQQIQNGKSYEKLVSNDTLFNIASTDLGWRKATDLPGIISGAAVTLKVGDTAKPIRSASGYHLVKLLDKRGDNEMIPQTKARHILLKPSAIRDEDTTEAEVRALRQRVNNGEEFADLAREYSEDIGSAVEGGDLSWTSPGQLVSAFQDAMDKTDIGQISTAFRSEYGWHILQVQERRQKDITDDLRSNMARNFIHKRKYDEELQTWLQKIRDEAYVDFK